MLSSPLAQVASSRPRPSRWDCPSEGAEFRFPQGQVDDVILGRPAHGVLQRGKLVGAVVGQKGMEGVPALLDLAQQFGFGDRFV